ncbi:MAG: hypothetical protein QOI12_445 [Alphaproteobacteria bacterium]|nr:hypothetical protein [Alphaproteobacteria bacterium]
MLRPNSTAAAPFRAMFKRLPADLALSALLCVIERVIERLLLPGLHRAAGRVAAADPSRADDLATLVAEILGLFAIVWLFNGTLYGLSWLYRRPLRPYLVVLVTLVIVSLIFASSYAQWASMPPAR